MAWPQATASVPSSTLSCLTRAHSHKRGPGIGGMYAGGGMYTRVCVYTGGPLRPDLRAKRFGLKIRLLQLAGFDAALGLEAGVVGLVGHLVLRVLTSAQGGCRSE